MSEIINIYTKWMPHKSLPYERDVFYSEEFERSKKWGDISRYIEVIFVFLFNEHGELIIQKRSKTKSHNPNLLDKSIGGHVQHWDNPNLTAMIETIQELQTPSIVLENRDDFLRTFDVLREYTTTTAVMQYIETRDFESIKVMQGERISIGNRAHIYFGTYAWRVKNVDKEAKWILYYSLDELKDEIESRGDIFTEDLRYILTHYEAEMRTFITLVWHQEK